MSRKKDLAKNTLVITVGNVCTKLITFILLPLYTSVLSTSEYGTVDLLNTLVSLMIPIVTFQIENAVFRELLDVRQSEDEKKSIISNSINFVTMQCIIYIITFLIISGFIKNDYKYFLGTNVLAFIYTSLFLQIARGLGDNKKYAFGSFVSAVSTVLLNVLFLVMFNFKVEGMLLSTLIGQIIGGMYLFISLKLYKYFKVTILNKEIIKKLLKYSIPLIPNAISWWIFNSSDRVIVSMVLGVSYTGILSASYKFSSAFTMIYNMFHLGWSESMSIHIKDKDVAEYFNEMFNLLVKFFISIGMVAISLMPFVWPIMVNKSFDYGYGLVIILLFAAMFQTIVGLTSVVYIGKKNTKAIANTSIMAAVLNIISHVLLIKFIGLYAAAISTIFAFAVMAIYRVYDVSKKYFKIYIEKAFLLKTVILTIFLVPSYYINNIIMNIVMIVICLIYAFDLNKNSIMSLKNMLLKRK